jgi:hypothetical protein
MSMAANSPDLNDIPSPGQATKADADWQRYKDAENTVMATEWKCRGDVYNAHIGDFAQPIADFSTSHTNAIAQAQAGWAQIEKEAAALGYNGQSGPLGK